MHNRRIHPADVRCHGSYIQDNPHWRLRRAIPKKVAAELVRIPPELHEEDYMWDNKGYIVVDRTYQILDVIVGGGEISDDLNLKVGDRAVDICDGIYRLFEYV